MTEARRIVVLLLMAAYAVWLMLGTTFIPIRRGGGPVAGGVELLALLSFFTLGYHASWRAKDAAPVRPVTNLR